jgi:hypothetical protein
MNWERFWDIVATLALGAAVMLLIFLPEMLIWQ